MSWSNNPYKNLQLHVEDPEHITLLCESCGWESQVFFNADDHLKVILIIWRDHLTRSHELSVEQTEKMSDY